MSENTEKAPVLETKNYPGAYTPAPVVAVDTTVLDRQAQEPAAAEDDGEQKAGTTEDKEKSTGGTTARKTSGTAKS